MEEIKILICGNYEKEKIKVYIENMNIDLNLDLIIKDLSKDTNNQNIEYYISLINNIEYFNVFILNFDKKEDIFDFFKSFNSEEYGITNECYPFFLINENILAKPEAKEFIVDLNKSKENEYKIKLGNILFYNEVESNDFQYIILNIYNCYRQDSKKLKDDNDSKETINILLIGVKNAGKSYLINKLLGETRALSMENHYTTKLTEYRHRKFPLVFYDIAGFNENEDDEINNLNSKIEEFNKIYKNLKKKIHVILYVIDCNSVRILQNKEKELIQNIFQINIPLFIIGQKAKITNKTNFIRKLKVELASFPQDYKEKIDNITNNKIFCLDNSKESYTDLLEQIYLEFYKYKEINDDIINSYSNLDDEELINNSISENFIRPNDEDKNDVLYIYSNYVKKSIFFNSFIESLKDVYDNVTQIKQRYLSQYYFIKSLDPNVLNNEIEGELQKIFSKEDLEKIYKIIREQQNDLNNRGQDIYQLKYYYGVGGLLSGITIPLAIFLTPFCWFALPVIGAIDVALLNKRDNKTKSIINQNIEHFYNKFEWKYILINLKLIKEKAENYNNAIKEFNNFVGDFKKNDFFD